MSIPLQLTLSDMKSLELLTNTHYLNSLGDRPHSMSADKLNVFIDLQKKSLENIDFKKFNVNSSEYKKLFVQKMANSTNMSMESIQGEFDFHLQILLEDFGQIESLESYPELEVIEIINLWD